LEISILLLKQSNFGHSGDIKQPFLGKYHLKKMALWGGDSHRKKLPQASALAS
jgi:hypothetical protein